MFANFMLYKKGPKEFSLRWKGKSFGSKCNRKQLIITISIFLSVPLIFTEKLGWNRVGSCNNKKARKKASYSQGKVVHGHKRIWQHCPRLGNGRCLGRPALLVQVAHHIIRIIVSFIVIILSPIQHILNCQGGPTCWHQATHRASRGKEVCDLRKFWSNISQTTRVFWPTNQKKWTIRQKKAWKLLKICPDNS